MKESWFLMEKLVVLKTGNEYKLWRLKLNNLELIWTINKGEFVRFNKWFEDLMQLEVEFKTFMKMEIQLSL